MAYQVIGEMRTVTRYKHGLGQPDARKPVQAPPPACIPLRTSLNSQCPFPPVEYFKNQNLLCGLINSAIKCADRAVSRLETRPISQDTADKFRKIFGQAHDTNWEIPSTPRQKMPAVEMATRRIKTVAKELQSRDTIYKCIPGNLCSQGAGGSSPEEPSHPLDTIVRDPLAWSVLCNDEVWLCPKFWFTTREEQVATILHEMFHLCFGLTCAWFQHDKKERRRNNAYCYEALILSLAVDRYAINPKRFDNTSP